MLMMQSETAAQEAQALTLRLRYLKRLDLYQCERPYQIFAYLQDSTIPRTNLEFEEGPEEQIYNIRGEDDLFSLDANGFCIVENEYSIEDCTNPESIKGLYLPKVKTILKQEIPSASEIHIIEFQIRKNIPCKEQITDLDDKSNYLLPSKHVHLDQHPIDVPRIVRSFMGSKAMELFQGRVQIINTWQPLIDIVYDRPLAICDGSTINEDELVAADHITTRHNSINSFAFYKKSRRWLYLNMQKRNEVIMFKNFDSDYNAPARCNHGCPNQSRIKG